MAVELEDIEAELSEILLPQPKRSLPPLNMVRDIAVSGEKVKLTLALSVLSATERERVQESVRAAIEALPGVNEVAIELVEHSPQELNEFDHVVAVMSGKGGVGKSLVTALLAKSITQFWQEVLWGKLDCLLVDLPPGTADIPLTVMQSLPLSGIVIVSTPQDLASTVVRKAVHMTHKLNIPILGVVENMSYLVIPETGKRIELFGRSRGEEMAREAEAPLLGQLPVDPELAALCDSGEIKRYNAEPFTSLSPAFIQAMPASSRTA